VEQGSPGEVILFSVGKSEEGEELAAWRFVERAASFGADVDRYVQCSQVVRDWERVPALMVASQQDEDLAWGEVAIAYKVRSNSGYSGGLVFLVGEP
jgi:hypothetical protein